MSVCISKTDINPFHHYGTTIYRPHSAVALHNVHFLVCDLESNSVSATALKLLCLLSSSIFSSLSWTRQDDKPFNPQDVTQSGFIQCLLMTRTRACIFAEIAQTYCSIPHTAFHREVHNVTLANPRWCQTLVTWSDHFLPVFFTLESPYLSLWLINIL